MSHLPFFHLWIPVWTTKIRSGKNYPNRSRNRCVAFLPQTSVFRDHPGPNTNKHTHVISPLLWVKSSRNQKAWAHEDLKHTKGVSEVCVWSCFHDSSKIVEPADDPKPILVSDVSRFPSPGQNTLTPFPFRSTDHGA